MGMGASSILSAIPVIETLQEGFPSCTLLGSVDGCYIMGPPEDAAQCLRRYGELLEASKAETASAHSASQSKNFLSKAVHCSL